MAMRVLSRKTALSLCIGVLLFSLVNCRSKKVVARRSGHEVTEEELEAALRGLPDHRREIFRDKVIDDLIEIKIFAEEARRAGLEKDLQIKKDLQKVEEETLARSFTEKYLDRQATPEEEDLEKFYLEHKSQFIIPESVFIQHLLVKSLEKAEELLAELRKGTPFEELARQKSVCRCWKKGGNHGWLLKGRMEPELEKAAFTLETGTLSEVMKTEKGYQVIKVIDRRNQKEIPFEEAKKNIHLILFQKNKNELIQQYYNRAKGDKKSSEEGVLVRIGEEVMREEDIAHILAKAPEKEKEMLRKRWINYFTELKVFSHEAKKVNLQNDPRVATELKRRKDQVLADAFQKQFITDKVKVSDREMEEYYRSHLDEYKVPVKVRVKSIVVETQEQAEDILQELREGASFSELAMTRSIHPSSSKAGEIGWFDQGEGEPALEAAALPLEKGEMSGIIKTEAGYEIIKLMDRKGGDVKSFDEVKQTIKMRLMVQKVEEEKACYYKKAGL
ncbi:MAG: peptidylprolyl isomerase [bacterium]